MSAPKPKAGVYAAIGSWVLALGLGGLLKSTLVLVIFAGVGVLFLALAGAGSEPAQRLVTALGHLPFVYDHQFKVVAEDYVGAHPTGDSPKAEQQELLRLIRRVRTELETCRSRINLARQTNLGWFGNRNLPSAAFREWSDSLVTTRDADANNALMKFYVWADMTNHTMSGREAREYNSVGEVMQGPGLTLDGADLATLTEGISLLTGALNKLAKTEQVARIALALFEAP